MPSLSSKPSLSPLPTLQARERRPGDRVAIQAEPVLERAALRGGAAPVLPGGRQGRDRSEQAARAQCGVSV